jgi:alkylhydroperoxidase family enzyme
LVGATEQQVEAARSGDAEAFSDDQPTRLFLALAEKITRHAYKVTDEDVEALREAGWDDEQIVEAVHVAASFNLVDRLADTFGLTAADMESDMARIREALGGS